MDILFYIVAGFLACWAFEILERRWKRRPQIPKGFKRWRGGSSPVSVFDIVEVVRRDGRQYTSSPRRIDWKHHGEPSDIVGYQVVGSQLSALGG